MGSIHPSVGFCTFWFASQEHVVCVFPAALVSLHLVLYFGNVLTILLQTPLHPHNCELCEGGGLYLHNARRWLGAGRVTEKRELMAIIDNGSAAGLLNK